MDPDLYYLTFRSFTGLFEGIGYEGVSEQPRLGRAVYPAADRGSPWRRWYALPAMVEAIDSGEAGAPQGGEWAAGTVMDFPVVQVYGTIQKW